MNFQDSDSLKLFIHTIILPFRYFRLDGNSLTGTVPTQLGRFSLLTHVFYLWQNDLSGALPTQLGELTGITSNFAVSSNNLSRELPSQLGRLSGLTSEFRLHVNQVRWKSFWKWRNLLSNDHHENFTTTHLICIVFRATSHRARTPVESHSFFWREL